jgi:serine/threonine-protein kinase
VLHDFAAGRTHVIDLDHYHRGPFVNHAGRLPGSTRFQAPEERVVGALVNETTTVFTLGRAMAEFLSDGTLERAPFCGGDALHAVLRAACSPSPGGRFPTVQALWDAWRAQRPTP